MKREQKKPASLKKKREGALRKAKLKRYSRWISAARFTLIGIVWSIIVLGSAVVWFGYDLPDITQLRQTTRLPGISVVTTKGELIATQGDIYGATVKVQELPAHVTGAILAAEDHRFYKHWGLDLWGILRASWKNFRAGRVVQGGSTLTQQLAKNFLLTEKLFSPADRSIRRKAQELMLSLWLEWTFTKDQILTIYLNRVYLGAGVYGIEAAAQRYFSKKAKHLTPYEAAVVAGLLKAPSRFSPLSNPEEAHNRAQIILDQMVAKEMVSSAHREKLRLMPKQLFKAHQTALRGRYFVDWVVEQLPLYIGPVTEDLLVVTTLDLRAQAAAEASVHQNLEKTDKQHHIQQAALVVMHPDGAIQALVGGRNYIESPFNRATQAWRQTGSAFKLFVYLAALEAGYLPQTLISDAPIRIGRWAPKNYHWKSQGVLSLKDSFAYSINTVAVRLAQKLGVKRIQNIVHRLQVPSHMTKDLSIALGSGDMVLLHLTAAYATVANGGALSQPYGILEVRTRYGKVLYRRRSPPSQRVIDYVHVKYLIDMMTAVMQYGTGKSARLEGEFCAGKTGTTQDHRDAWFVGINGRLALIAGVWCGNDNREPMGQVTGGTLPARIWKTFMEKM